MAKDIAINADGSIVITDKGARWDLAPQQIKAHLQEPTVGEALTPAIATQIALNEKSIIDKLVR